MINEKISKNYLKVLTSLNSKKFRQKYQLFIVEGEKIISELILSNPQIIKYLIVNDNYKDIEQILNKFNIYRADHTAFSRISSMATPPPILAVCDMENYFKIKFETQYPYSLYLDDVRDPGNIGTIIRTAEWFGVQNIYLSEGSVDLFHPRLIQASMGSFFRISCNLLPANDIAILPKPLIGAVLDGMSIDKWILPGKGTIIVGNESNGISSDLISLLDQKVSIPAAGTNRAESLNVSIATAVLLNAIRHQKVDI